MTGQDFIELKDYILSKNTYFDKGYANAFKDSNSNYPMARMESGDLNIVFPQDIDGNYFYLRDSAGVQYQIRDGLELSACDGAVFSDNIDLFMVCVMKEVEPYILLENIRNTVLSYSKMRVVPVGARWNREQITIDEMAGCDETDIAAALQRWDKQSVVRLQLRITKKWTQNSCPIVNPCKC